MEISYLKFLVFYLSSVAFFVNGQEEEQNGESAFLPSEEMYQKGLHGEHDNARFISRSGFSKKGNPRKGPLLMRDKKPNIILVLTDDQDIELGSMNFMPKTLRILGDGGAHFSNAYVTTPMCCPSRSSLLTGLYVHNHQVHTNNDNCSSPWWQQEHETRTFATYLSNAGYRTAYFGKYLNEYNGTYIPPGWREWAGLIRNSRFYNYSINVNGNKIKHGDDYFKDYYPDLIANDSISFLRRSKRHFVNKPVMMVLSFPSPHGPEDAAPQYQNLFRNVTTHRTPSWNYAPNLDKQWLLRNTGKMEPIHIHFTDVLHTKRLQTLQSVDDAVEKLYRELRALRELDNTYIFYTSDHGYHLGQFGLVKGKSMPFEFDVRVPFLVRGPGVPRGVRIQDIVLNIDIAPTFLDIADVDVPENMDGRSILSLLRDADAWASSGHRHTEVRRKKSWRDSFLIERGVVNTYRRGIKNGEHMLIRRMNKEQRLELECQKPHYASPCRLYQKWECLHDGYRWRIHKCRNPYFLTTNNCVCPEDDEDVPFPELQRKPNPRTEFQTRNKPRKFFRSQERKPSYLGSRRKRTTASATDFDLEGIQQLYHLLDATVGTKSEERNLSVASLTEEPFPVATESIIEEEEDRGKRETPSIDFDVDDDTPDCSLASRFDCEDEEDNIQNPILWHQRKEKLDGMIKTLRHKLEQLKGIRKQLKKAKPSHKNSLDSTSHIDRTCMCDDAHSRQLKEERRRRRDDLKRERQLRREEHLKKLERKMRRKSKFENMTCNVEKMNCFTQDNNHWKTPPLWTEGPFCFCQNANNNTFWCLRTINETHNFLYCEFVTGFITFYDLRTDPYQMRNAVYDLDYGTLELLRMRLNRLRACKGSKQCTLRSHHNGSRAIGLQRGRHNGQRYALDGKARSLRHWKNGSPRWPPRGKGGRLPNQHQPRE